jgi:DNA-binding transcriptional LysR family regulator
VQASRFELVINMRTARALNMGQPAISKTVAQLEARLGVRLLMRSTHGLAPTEAGQSFYERAKRSIEEADEAEAVARGAGKGLTGRLRISAAVTFARLHIVPHLPKFLAAHPDLTLDVVLDDRIIDLIEEGVDIALRMGPLADSTSLSARKLASAPPCAGNSGLFLPIRRAGDARRARRTCCGDLHPGGRGHVVLSPGRDRGFGHRLRAAAGERGRGRALRRAGGYGPDHHVGVDVRSGAQIGRRATGADGLVVAADRSLGGLSNRPHAQRQGARLRGICRSGVDAGVIGTGAVEGLAGACRNLADRERKFSVVSVVASCGQTVHPST